jgi:hypothetical protein
MQYHSVITNRTYQRQSSMLKEAQLALLGRLLAAGGRGLGRVASKGAGGLLSRGTGGLGNLMQRGGYQMVQHSPLRQAMQALGRRTGMGLTANMPAGLGREMALRRMAATQGAAPGMVSQQALMGAGTRGPGQVIPRDWARALEPTPPTVSRAALMQAGSPAPQMRVPPEVLARAGSPLAAGVPILPTAARMRDLYTGYPRQLGSAHPLNMPSEVTGAMPGGGQLLQFPGYQFPGSQFPVPTGLPLRPAQAASWSAYDQMIQKSAFLNFLISRMAS